MRNKIWLYAILILFGLLCKDYAIAQPKAAFSALATTGCSPLLVQFKDESTDGPTEWFWDLGNGSTSTLQNPGVIYINPGIYSIKLKVKNASGIDSITRTNYISVSSKPIVNFDGQNKTGCAPLTVSFQDLSNPFSGNISSWNWDFGDGNISTEQSPTHTYITSDTFSVTLTITNSSGCRQTLQQKDFIQVLFTPTASFDYDYTNVCKPPALVNFINTTKSRSGTKWQWQFGDGTNSTQFSPSHTYNTSGNFTAALTAVSAEGCSDTAKSIIAIGSTKANFTTSTNNCVNELISFRDSSTPSAINGYWDFGDGTVDTGLSVQHRFVTEGLYQISYTADFGACSDIIRKNIRVTNKPTADFSVSGNNASCNPPLTVSFQNNSVGATNYSWNFGDGTITGGLNPTHTYTTVGNFSVTLVAINANGCSDTIQKAGIIKLGPPEILSFETLPTSGCVPVTVQLKAKTQSPEPINSWLWTFGDGNSSTAQSPTHTYTNVGNYNVRLIVTTVSGCADTLFMADAVLVGNKPNAMFSADPRKGCADTLVVFSDGSNGNVTDWFWDFGDGSTSTEQNPDHIYTDTGYFTVQLIVSSNGCYDTISKENYIYTLPPVASFKKIIPCSNPYNIKFIDSSIAPQTWFWDFGDGFTTTDQNPTHLYQDTGTYTVSLTVTNGACDYTNTEVVKVIDEKPGFDYRPIKTNYCKYDTVQFNVTNYNPNNIMAFNWDFGDQVSSGFSALYDTVLHTYTAAGIYYPELLIKDINGCIDTVSNGISITIYGPQAGFSNTAGGCENTTIIFQDETITDGIHPLVQWTWDYGDNTIQTYTAPPFAHFYSTSGQYDVLMKVFDNNGCMDSMYKPKGIQITDPIANFSAENLLSCTDYRVQFIDSVDALSPLYFWDFGDGNTSQNPEPKHSYANEGIYTVRLKIIDIYGCPDSLEKMNYITIADPVALFNLSDTFFLCPPATIQLNDASLNTTEWFWDFGNGNSSNEVNPSQIYAEPGEYSVQLIATGYGTCYDTLIKKMVLKGPEAILSYTPLQGCNPLEVKFKAVAKNTSKFIWDFGNGATLSTSTDSIKYIYTSTGLYTPRLVIEDGGGCQVPVINPDTIRVTGADAYFTANTVSLCDSAKVGFTQNAVAFEDDIIGYHWFFGDGDSSIIPNTLHFYTDTGLYNTRLKIITATGCEIIKDSTIYIDFEVTPQIVPSVTPSACLGEPILFNASDAKNTAVAWKWKTGNGDSVLQKQMVYLYKQPGSFDVSLTATGLKGCSDTAYEQVIIYSLPIVSTIPNETICQGSTKLLPTTGASIYSWRNSNTLSCIDCDAPIAAPIFTETFYVTGTDLNGCKASDSVTIFVITPTPLIPPPADTLCEGNSIKASASGADIYLWQPPTGVSSINEKAPIFSPITTTTYQVIGTDKLGCFRDSADFKITVFPIPQVSIGEPIIALNAGENYMPTVVNSTDVTSWQWTPPTGLSCTDCKQPLIQPRGAATYTLTVANAGGCTNTAQITVNVLCKNENLFIPNTFSPNNDGMNDVFYARGNGLLNIKSFRIFNRWGQVVFERTNLQANDANAGWNGKYNNQMQMADVYVYIVDVMCDNGIILSRKGNLTLLR